ncbi:MAG: prepilin peptidase [Candidatus Omnitrophota bacterium]
MVEQFFAFIIGSVIGSFLNVCIHRMPYEGYSLVKPSSHCPHCKKPIAWYDNVPILAYILLAGKCRWCKAKISPRYFVVELLTALTLLFLYSQFGVSYNLFVYFIFLCGLIVATFIDIQHRIIPDEISLGGMAVGFLLVSFKGINFHPFGFNYRPMLNSFLGIIIGGGIIYLTGFIFDLIYFKLLKKPPIQGETESMGGGDVKLLAMIGAFLGWERALLTFFLAPFFGAIVGIINLAVKKDHTIPYGPFLSMAAVLSLFWADKIIALVIFR